MHTFKHGETVFWHNGGFDGDVHIKRHNGELALPFADLRALVAEYVRRQQIAKLERAGDGQLLGVRCTDDVPCPACGDPSRPTSLTQNGVTRRTCPSCCHSFLPSGNPR